MDAQRALLDSLMGFNRDGDRPDEAALDFRHPRVCKPYLCGLCPRDLFQNTRLDAGACESLHLPTLRSAYQQQQQEQEREQEQESRRDFGYERALANELSKLLADVEKKIARAQRRLAEGGDDGQDRPQILQLTQDLQDAEAQAAKDGDASRSLPAMEKVELLKRKRRELLRQSSAGASGAVDSVNQKLRVCDVCGAFLSIFDSERRLADHFGGKVHVGYVQIRQKLKQLVETEEKEAKRRRRSASRKRAERPTSRRDERGREEDRERRRERGRSRSRSRRRSRERESRSRHRTRSVSCSRSRSRSRERKRRRSHRHRH